MRGIHISPSVELFALRSIQNKKEQGLGPLSGEGARTPEECSARRRFHLRLVGRGATNVLGTASSGMWSNMGGVRISML